MARLLDPTRTYTLRRASVAATRARFASLKRDINALVVREDAFGLIANKRWRFLTNPDKLTAFQKWLKSRIDAGILVPEGPSTGAKWLTKYVTSAYRTGRVNAYTAAKPDLAGTTDFMAGTRAGFLQAAFSIPEQTAKVELLATRTYSALKGITDAMDAQMSRVLADSMSQGWGAQKTARALVKTVDKLTNTRALTLARTELMHGHAEGQLDSFEDLGIAEVGLLAEWSTAHDNGVCPLCAPLEGAVFTVAKARGLIPRHPSCRCSWVPYLKPRNGRGRRPSRRPVAASIQAERPRKPLATAIDATTWLGGDLLVK